MHRWHKEAVSYQRENEEKGLGKHGELCLQYTSAKVVSNMFVGSPPTQLLRPELTICGTAGRHHSGWTSRLSG